MMVQGPGRFFRTCTRTSSNQTGVVLAVLAGRKEDKNLEKDGVRRQRR